MPRQRNPKRDVAKELWLASGKSKLLKEIAAELEIKESTVRRWKHEDAWAGGRSKKKTSVKKKKGGQPGNKNAIGNKGGPGAPPRNDHAVTHGAYRRIYYDTLSKEEQELMDAIELDPETIIRHQLIDLTLKARRLKRRIAAEEATRGGLSLDGVVREKTPTGEKTTTITTTIFERILKLERELDATEGRINRVTDTLIRYRAERDRFALDCKRLELTRQKIAGEIELELEGEEYVEVDDLDEELE